MLETVRQREGSGELLHHGYRTSEVVDLVIMAMVGQHWEHSHCYQQVHWKLACIRDGYI